MAKAKTNLAELRILIADDHELLLRGLRTVLEEEPGWKVVAEVRDGQEAVEKARELKPDIAIMGISLPRLNGLDAARRIMKMFNETKVLFLTMHESDQVVRDVLETGALGYVTKSGPAKDVILAVQAISRGRTFFTQHLNQMMVASYVDAKTRGKGDKRQNGKLTTRQREIVQLLAEGKSSKEVGILLNLSTKTIETHRAQIMARLDCHCISDLVRYAIRNNIISA